VLAGILAWAALALVPAAQAAGGPWHDWVGTSGDNAGHAVVDRGDAIWTNYLFDDYGANVDGFQSMDPDLLIVILSPHAYPGDPAHPVGFAPSGNIGRFRHSGDYSYPPDQPYPQDPANDPLGDNATYQNAANVTETRVAATAQDVYFRFSLTNLGGDPSLTTPRADSTVIGVAIDTDPSVAAGGGAWPFAAGLTTSGWKRFLTVWGTGGALTTSGGASQDLAAVGGSVREDLAANTIEVRVPRGAIAPAGETKWRLIAGAGRWDAATSTWAVPLATTTQTSSPGSLLLHPRVYELPFHHDEPNSLWNDTRQANDLRDGTVGAADSWDVDLHQLQGHDTVPVPCQPGPREETFTSSLGFGPGVRTEEGLTPLPTQNGGVGNLHNVNYIYRWHVQPLAVMLPPSACDASAPAPSLDYVFHPANVNHNAWFVGVEGDQQRVTYLNDPPLGYSYVTSLSAQHNRITASGLAKTEGWNYGDAPGEEVGDWDAFNAVTHRYRYDPDHVRLMGMSGRLGAYFFGEMWPDRVASMVTVSNHDADGPRIANLRNTPSVFMHGDQFLEVDPSLLTYKALDDHMNALGYQYLHMTWATRGHDFNLLDQTYDLVEPWTNAPRIHPARITYYLDPKDRRPDLPLFPGVDWVRDITLADDSKPAQFDLTDLARADRLPVRETRFDCFFANPGTSDNVEYHGLSYETPEVVRARMPDVVGSGWTATSCNVSETPLSRPAVANAISGDLSNLSSVTLDLDEMGIDPTQPIDLSGIHTSGPVTLYLHSARGDLTIHLGGAAARRGAQQAVRRAAGRLRARLSVRRGRRLLLIVSGTAPRGARVLVRLQRGRRTVSVRRARARAVGTYRARFRVRRGGRYRALVTARTGGVLLTARTPARTVRRR
jgi:hypothetical protein